MVHGNMASGSKIDGKISVKSLHDELDQLNRRGKAKPLYTIESASTFQDLGTNIGREEMFKLIKELYGFGKRALDLVKGKEARPGSLV